MSKNKKKLSSKTSALILLNKKLKTKKHRIPNFIYFSKKDFKKNKDKIFLKIKKNFKKKIILRSSSLAEDQEYMSSAGKFKSFSNVKIDKTIIFQKINEIISDYKNKDDQIIVQNYEKKILLSGVIFTRDQNNNGPYYIINFDKSGRTDLVTSGKYNPSSKTIVIYKNSKNIPVIFYNLINIIKKIEKIFKSERLDIEFAIEKKTNKILIFQCRKLFDHKKILNFDKEIAVTINNIKKKLIKLKKQNPYLAGSTTVFSNMTDWNPAEMIGSKPKNLSISLYSELITNEIWSKQRANYGYTNVYPNNLMFSFAGSPFIDLRTDFNSFIPEGLNKSTRHKIINHSIKQIFKNPEYHDKVEFKVIPTCFDFSEKNAFKYVLNKNEYKDYLISLKKLTFNVLLNYKNILSGEEKKLNLLSTQILKIQKSKLSHIQKIFYLVNDCKSNGTLPFAGIARCAFIATKILQTFVDKKIISIYQYNSFFNQLNSITDQISKDHEKYLKKKIKKKVFIKNYGHLRPQTYSINSPNYAKGFDKYFPKNINKKRISKKSTFKLSKNQLDKVRKIFKKNKIIYSPNNFLDFAKKSIKLREWGKFIFTKSINEIFFNLEVLGKEIKIPKSDFDYISIDTILKYNSNLNQKRIKVLLQNEIDENKKSMSILEQVKLPDLITEVKDLDFFYLNIVKGNFITNLSTYGNLKLFSKIKSLNELKNSIILIDNADPGYDFLFSYNIKGLITKYGGANSHMAIRCMELQIPAIIGIGEKNFNHLKDKNSLLINCDQKFFKVLN